MGSTKISFLIAAHNEEKTIGKVLKNLVNLPYNKHEIIIGLDGCTDNTEKIILEYMKSFSKIKMFKLNLRSGKPAVINSIIEQASGEIIIINDADWIFRVPSLKDLEALISTFNDPLVGGIAEAYPAEWNSARGPVGNMSFKMIAHSSAYWLEFQKKKFTKMKDGQNIVSKPTMFMTNVFLKKLYRKNSTLGDDLERTRDIIKEGYKIVVPKNLNFPRMVVSYNKVNLGDLIKQKRRTALARKQLGQRYDRDLTFFNYYIPSMFYILASGWRHSLRVGLYMTFWSAIMGYSELYARFAAADTRKAWKLRLRR